MKKLSEMYIQNWATAVRMDMVAYWSLDEDEENWMNSIVWHDKNMKVIFETAYYKDDDHSQSDLDMVIEALTKNWFIIN